MRAPMTGPAYLSILVTAKVMGTLQAVHLRDVPALALGDGGDVFVLA